MAFAGIPVFRKRHARNFPAAAKDLKINWN